jgi:hypothetical protein
MKIYSEQRKLLNKEKKMQSQTASSALLLSASSSIPSSTLIKKRERMKTMKARRNIIVNSHDINGASKKIARYDNDDYGVVAIIIEYELSP